VGSLKASDNPSDIPLDPFQIQVWMVTAAECVETCIFSLITYKLKIRKAFQEMMQMLRILNS